MTPVPTIDTQHDVRELRFEEGLPGFPECKEFVLVRWGDESSPFSLLRAAHDDLSFVVVPPAVFFPDYAPEIDIEAVAPIGIEQAEDALLLTIVTVREPIDRSTANLLGPIIVNVHDLRAVQAVLDPDRYSATTPLIGTN